MLIAKHIDVCRTGWRGRPTNENTIKKINQTLIHLAAIKWDRLLINTTTRTSVCVRRSHGFQLENVIIHLNNRIIGNSIAFLQLVEHQTNY